MRLILFEIGVGAFGAAVQEGLYWWNVRKKLDDQEIQKIKAHFGAYILIVLAMIFCSGVAGYLWFRPAHETARTYLLFGAAFPVLFKKVVDAFISDSPKLGNGTLRAYLKAS